MRVNFFKIYPITPQPNWILLLAFYREKGPFDEELDEDLFSKMATDCAISLECFLEVEVILEV